MRCHVQNRQVHRDRKWLVVARGLGDGDEDDADAGDEDGEEEAAIMTVVTI